MYDLQTIKRLNDDAAIREQFPEHNCRETLEDEDPNLVILTYDEYIPQDTLDNVTHDRDVLVGVLQDILRRLPYGGPETVTFDAWDRADIERSLEDLYESS